MKTNKHKCRINILLMKKTISQEKHNQQKKIVGKVFFSPCPYSNNLFYFFGIYLLKEIAHRRLMSSNHGSSVVTSLILSMLPVALVHEYILFCFLFYFILLLFLFEQQQRVCGVTAEVMKNDFWSREKVSNFYFYVN